MRGSGLERDPPGRVGGQDEKFDTVIAPLADGELTFAPPFDFNSSSALARNIDVGRIAELLFAVDQRRRLDYVIHISVRSPDQPSLGEREIVNTVTDSEYTLVHILSALVDELVTRQEEEQHDG